MAFGRSIGIIGCVSRATSDNEQSVKSLRGARRGPFRRPSREPPTTGRRSQGARALSAPPCGEEPVAGNGRARPHGPLGAALSSSSRSVEAFRMESSFHATPSSQILGHFSSPGVWGPIGNHFSRLTRPTLGGGPPPGGTLAAAPVCDTMPRGEAPGLAVGPAARGARVMSRGTSLAMLDLAAET
jgi:hypothetical protein